MVDTFIANASVEEYREPFLFYPLNKADISLHSLRSTVRTLLATTPPSTATAFCRAARLHLSKGSAKSFPKSNALFNRTSTGEALPTPYLRETLSHARILYGAGMGFASLSIFATIVHQTVGLQWTGEGETVEVLTLIDGDMCQAMQSCKEELERGAGAATEVQGPRETVDELRAAVVASERDVASWGGEFPFERALASLECWKI